MSDDEKRVGISADQGLESFGKNAYFAARDGNFDNKGLRSSLIFTIGSIAIIALIMMYTSKKPRDERSGRQVASPPLTRDYPIHSPRLMTERDLTNVIRRPRVDISVLGKIKVVSLRSVSEIPIGSEMKAILESGATDGIVKARICPLNSIPVFSLITTLREVVYYAAIVFVVTICVCIYGGLHDSEKDAGIIFRGTAT